MAGKKDCFPPAVPVKFCICYFSELGQKPTPGALTVAGRGEHSEELGWGPLLIGRLGIGLLPLNHKDWNLG